jgi:hypothetical protein
MFEKGAIPIINRPTRVSEHSATLIDNIITTEIFEKSLRKGIIKTDVSDHFPIFFALNYSKRKCNEPNKKIRKRIFNEANLESFKEQLSLLHWQQIDFTENANIIYEKFHQTIFDVYDANFPINEYVLKGKDLKSPWITKGIKKSSKRKQKLYINYLKNKTPENYKLYKDYQTIFEKLRNKAKKNYYTNLIKKHQHNMKKSWQIMKEITGKLKPKSNSLPKTIKINGKLLYNNKIIANEFNNFFTKVGPSLAEKIPATQTKFTEYITPSAQNLEASELQFEEFEKALKSLQRNKAVGVDNLNGNIIIDSLESMKDILYLVFKASLKQGIFPEKLKIGKVTPIFKSGDQTNVSNYRPISVLPVFSKILERIMYNRVYDYLVLNNLLYEKQFGFRTKASTEHAILQLTSDISESFERGECTLGVFIDLSKAFDTVNHDILLKKLESYGIKGITLAWFSSYLSNRTQYIAYDGNLSDCLNITCGVPQGSILGPLLFLIYVNDLSKVSKILSTIMFADDTNLFLSHKNIKTLFEDVNRELEKLTVWFQANKLSLNVNKTKWSLFHSASKKRFLPEFLPGLSINGIEIKRDIITKFLGVYIDENISWKYHIDTICTKVSKSIGILYKAREFLDKHNLKQLYFSFIHSYINYANIAWASTHKTKLGKLYRCQKHAARVINFKDKMTSAKPLLENMKALTVYELNVFNVLSFVYKAKHKLCPPIFNDIYTLKPINKYTLRNEGLLFEPTIHTDLSKFCINYRAPHLWNMIIPGKINLPKTPSLSSFKKVLKESLIQIDIVNIYF